MTEILSFWLFKQHFKRLCGWFSDAGVTHLVKCHEYPLSVQKETTERGFDRKKSVTDIHRGRGIFTKHNVLLTRSLKLQCWLYQMYEFVLVTKQTIYVYLSWQRILMIQDAESFGFTDFLWNILFRKPSVYFQTVTKSKRVRNKF
jgi:hypothetical protein